MIPPTNAEVRYELKFVADQWHYDALVQWLRYKPEGFRRAYPSRQVNSVYFDRGDCASYSESLEGISSRAKVRFRWYGESAVPESGRLEVKLRSNRAGWKLVYGVDSLGDSPTRWRALRTRLGEELPDEGRIWIQEYGENIVIISYWRDYWESGDGLLRVTFDTDVRAYDQRFERGLSLRRRTPLDYSVVVEVKCRPEYADRASSLISDLAVPRLRNSKYCTAVEAILGM